MKRTGFFICIAITAALLAGCSSVDSYLERVFLEKSGILDDADYSEYAELEKNNRLNPEGVSVDVDKLDTPEEPATRTGSIHVTFANNRYLTMNYYTDPECNERIVPETCYLNPGDAIYASVESNNPNTNLYGIKGYRIYENDTDNTMKRIIEQEATTALVYQIPEGFTGTELSIVPIGEYPDRTLSMCAFFIDDSGKQQKLGNAGVWAINGIENVNSISPIEPYILTYDFDEKNYFFVGSSPKCFTESPDEVGRVEFWEANPTDEAAEYSVELHVYLKLTVSPTEDVTVQLNAGEATVVKKGKTWSGEKLKYGDTIVIDTSGECKLSATGDYTHVKAEKDPTVNGSRYTLRITSDTSGNLSNVIEVDEEIVLILPGTADHGTCTYKLDGKEVSGKITMRKSQKLTITYRIVNSDYKFSDGNIVNWLEDLVTDMTKTVTIEVNAGMNNKTIRPDDYFTIVKKGE